MIQKPKGTLDIIENSKKYRYVEEIFNSVCSFYNYTEIRTPIFERTELFSRSVGESSDIVNKEMYEFLDKGNRSISLRPEGTASVARAYIENKLYSNPTQPQKFYYIQPMFRYERPQKGRLRQFSQFGIEAMGSNNPVLDAEIISIMCNTLKVLGLKGIKVKINTLGDDETRENYKVEIKKHFKEHISSFCGDCQKRYDINPLRILDCKIDRENEIFKSTPKMSDFLSEESRDHFDKVLGHLNDLEIEYEIDDNLVRGLDYYSHTVFEIESTSKMGTQNVICGGGRYNKLISELGGPKTNCIGAAMGIDRLIIALENEGISLGAEDGVDVYLLSLGENAQKTSLRLSNALRMSGYITEIDYDNKGMKAQFKKAERSNAKAIVIFGDKEIENNKFNVKIAGQEETVEADKIIEYLDSKLGGHHHD